MPVTITKGDDATLLVKGLSLLKDYDDTMLLDYDSETGYLSFAFQQVASIDGYYGFVAPFNSATSSVGTKAGESLVGGLTKDGVLTFLNNPANTGVYDSMVYLVSPDGKNIQFMSGYWNGLAWASANAASSSSSLETLKFNTNSKSVEKNIVPKRIYRTELNLNASPIRPQMTSTQTQIVPNGDFSLVAH